MSANVVAAVPPGQTGVATGMNANIRTIGGSIGAAVMASIVTAKLEPSWPAGRVRLHDRVRGHGRRPGGGRAGRVVDPPQPGLDRAAAEQAAVGALAMSGDAVTAESAAGETVASELGD